MDHFQISVLGKALIVIGGIILLLGLMILVTGKAPFPGKLPGDVHLKGRNWSFHFPVVTSIIVSILLTLIVNLIFRK